MRGAWRVIGDGAGEDRDRVVDDRIQRHQAVADGVRRARQIDDQVFVHACR